MERYRKTLKEGSRKITRAEERERNETRETEGEGSNEGERTREIDHVLTPMVFNTPEREFANSCKVSRRQLLTGAFAKAIINTLCFFPNRPLQRKRWKVTLLWTFASTRKMTSEKARLSQTSRRRSARPPTRLPISAPHPPTARFFASRLTKPRSLDIHLSRRCKGHLNFHVLRCKPALCNRLFVVFVCDRVGLIFLKLISLSFWFVPLLGGLFL